MQPFVGSVSLSQNLMSSSSFFTTTCNVGSEEVLITVFGNEDDLTLKVARSQS
jgi:hypothetical protein